MEGARLYPFFAMLSRMKYINRWGLMRNTRSENICEHSLEVALVAHALATLGNQKFGKHYDPERAAMLAVLHDASEIITGDMPTPVKYHSEEIRRAYSEVEDLAVEHLVKMLPEELRPTLVLGLGVAKEVRRVADVPESGALGYWRDADQVHYVPKLALDKLVLNRF